MKYSLIISSILLVLIDLVYLSIIGKPVFEKTVSAIQGTKLVVNIPPAIFTYILMAFILNYFIISANYLFQIVNSLEGKEIIIHAFNDCELDENEKAVAVKITDEIESKFFIHCLYPDLEVN